MLTIMAICSSCDSYGNFACSVMACFMMGM